MKRLLFLFSILWTVMTIPIESGHAETSTAKLIPKVPITYPGDTNETIARRAQWIEGAKREGALDWWGSTNPGEANKIIADFNALYPFIKVNYWRGGDQERVARLESEHSIGRLTVDMMEGGAPTNLPRWRKMGIPAKYVDIIPEIKRLDRRMYSRYGDWAGSEHVAHSLLYNKKLVSASEAPKSWEDLLNPKWRGQIGMQPDMSRWYVLALAEGGWGIEKTESYLTRLRQLTPVWTPGLSAGFALLIAGEFKIQATGAIRYILQSPPEKMAIVDWARINPIVVVGGFNILPAKAPHPNAARLWMEWLYSSRGLKIVEEATGKGLTFPGSVTRQAKAVEGLHLIYKTEDVVLKAGELGLTDRFAKILGVTPE